MKEMSEFCKSVKLGRFKKKKNCKRLCSTLHFTLLNQCWFIRMLVIAARCSRK